MATTNPGTTVEEVEHKFAVGSPDSSDDDEAVEEPTPPPIAVTTELLNPGQPSAVTTAVQRLPAAPAFVSWVMLWIGSLAAFVCECVVLSHRDAGWADVIAMSQTKNYDSVVATYGWYEVDVIAADVALRSPDWASAVGFLGALTIVACFVCCCVICHAAFKHTTRYVRRFQLVYQLLGISGIAVWVLYTVNVTSYINTRDFYWQLKGSNVMFLLNHVTLLIASVWIAKPKAC
jgi:hypothetical protein